jgi:hypothetical protein
MNKFQAGSADAGSAPMQGHMQSFVSAISKNIAEFIAIS